MEPKDVTPVELRDGMYYKVWQASVWVPTDLEVE